jgi:hypothetical protein
VFGEPAFLRPLGLLPGVVGAVLGWWWSYALRRRHGESSDGVSFKRPGLAGLIGGGIGVIIGAAAMLFSEAAGGAIMGVSVVEMVAVPAYYWILRPVYRWQRSR